ncbi:S-layer homology domain-containing protein [Bacillus sp. FSL W8-0116]|uniref:S-layer homology domain-containing protein n=1 Tax=Bacillus sp. FSL W8-0116 TaxID=2978206 RepID=UPI0030F4C5A3
MKKVIPILALLLALLVPFKMVSAAEKTSDMYYPEDVDDDYWAHDEIQDFLSADIIDGKIQYDEDGFPSVYVKPNENITRAEFTKMIVNAMGLELKGKAKSFADVKSGAWYYPYVQIASSNGIISGRNDGTFHPGDKIKRSEIAKMVYNAFQNTIQFNPIRKTFSDVPKSSFAYEAIHKNAANGIIQGYGTTFKPNDLATRAQAIVMIYRALHQETTALPDKQQLIDFVKQFESNESQYIKNQNFDALTQLYKDNTIGYYRASGLESIDFYQSLKNENAQITIEPIGDPTYNVKTLNNRYATVELTNAKVKITLKSPDFNFDVTEDLSGLFFLKLDSKSQKWKIYDFQAYSTDPDELPLFGL